MTDTQNTTEHTSEKTAGASKGLLIGGLVVAALGVLVAAGLWKAATRAGPPAGHG